MCVKLATYLFGVPVYLDSNLGYFIQRRTHKKRRINKKWKKMYGCVFVSSDQIIMVDPGWLNKKMIMHPDTWAIINRTLAQKEGSVDHEANI